MAFGWIKALQLAYSLYSTGSKVAPLLRRYEAAARNEPMTNHALEEMTAVMRQLSVEAAKNRKILSTVRAATYIALAVSIVTLIIVIFHVAHA